MTDATKISQPDSRNKVLTFVFDAFEKINESIYDVILTIVILGFMGSIYFEVAPALFSWAFAFTAAIYFILLMIRIVHKFDQSWTLDEIGNMLNNYIELRKEKNDL